MSKKSLKPRFLVDAVSPIRVLRLRQQLKGEKSCVCGLTWRTCANPARITGDHGRPHPPERRLQAHHSWTAGCQVLERTSVRYMLTFTHPFINFWSNPFVSLGDRRQLLSESLLIFPSMLFEIVNWDIFSLCRGESKGCVSEYTWHTYQECQTQLRILAVGDTT